MVSFILTFQKKNLYVFVLLTFLFISPWFDQYNYILCLKNHVKAEHTQFGSRDNTSGVNIVPSTGETPYRPALGHNQ
jgi:hypothetical protein